MPLPYTVHIVDDDSSVRDALSLLLGIHGYRLSVFADAESFLNAFQPSWRGCVLLDIRMPGMNGLKLQKLLVEQGGTLPIIIMTGHGDIDSACTAFKQSAIDFLEKPLDHERLLAAIEAAFARQEKVADKEDKRKTAELMVERLTQRELEVMTYVINGRHNREIAQELGISPRTVEVHKAHMMEKMGARTVADLVRTTLWLEEGSV